MRCWSLPPRVLPRGCPPFPRPLPRSLVPAVSRPSLLSVPALARWFALFFFFCLASPPLAARLSPRRFSLSSAPPPHVFSPSPRRPRPLPGWVGEKGVGGGRPRCLSSGVSTSQARHRHEALGPARRVLSSGTVVWSVPHPLSAASPPCSFVLGGGGGALSAPPYLHPHPWGGGGVVGGGGRHDASTAQARGAALVPLQGGGGLAVWLPSSPFLPCVRTPGGPPVGDCTARAPYGHGRVVRPAPSLRCPPTLPLCPRGGGAFRPPPPTFIPHPWGGGGVWGGGAPLSSSLRSTHVAGTTQARGEALGCSGGGVSPLGLPALLHGTGSAPQDLQPLLPLGGSRHVSARCLVSRACSLLCPYLLEEVRTRVETDDEEVRAAGRTYRTPRRLLAPSAALVEGRAPVSAPNSPGGADCPSSPWCPCIHFRAAWYRCRVISPLEVAATKRPGALVPRVSATPERDGGP